MDDDGLAGLRVEYRGEGFSPDDAGPDPMACFRAWFAQAREELPDVEVNAMALATVADDGTPSVRMVLLKGVDARRAAFTWYTNLDSRKAREQRASGRAALCWWWPGAPGRQVRAVGRVEPVDRAEAAAYFATRPPDSQVGAVASHQSRALHDRAELLARADVARRAQQSGNAIALPEGWGGLRLVADELEFWQGAPGRLHDRVAFLRVDDGAVTARAGVDAAGGPAALDAAATEVTDPHGTTWLRTRLEP